MGAGTELERFSVALVKPDGGVADFVMNDRCAAGTGRFLEVLAARLGVKRAL